MTTQKPELMPDEVFVGKTKIDRDAYLLSFKSKHEQATSYTRTDLYTAACAERDALRALCEGMAESIKIVRQIISEASNTGFNYRCGDWPDRLYQSQANTYKSLAAYEKHKGVG